MAVNYQSGAWNSSSILQGYGLMSVIGPTEPTKEDIKRLNSRSGGKHAGHGNWMQTFNPRPVIKNGFATKVYDYGQGSDVIVQSRLPSLATRKVGKFRGFKRSPNVLLKLGPATDIDGTQKEEKDKVDEILVPNRKKSDASMPPVSPVAENVVASPTATEMPEAVDQGYRKMIGPSPGQYLNAQNSNVDNWAVAKIYSGRPSNSYGLNDEDTKNG